MKKMVLNTLIVIVAASAALGAYAFLGFHNRLEQLKMSRKITPYTGTGATVYAAAMDRIDLTGKWKFSVDPGNIGQAQNWQKPELDTQNWRDINVPGAWEDQGITQANPSYKSVDPSLTYSGYAWYRRTVAIPADWQGKTFFLNLGKIDDQDWTYFNGQLIGQTTTQVGAADVVRSYTIPAGLIKFNQPNVIAVRVLDTGGRGGIVEGPVSLSTGGADAAIAPESDNTDNAKDKIQVTGDVTVDKGQTVNDALAVNGDVTVSGHVKGDAIAVMGDVVIECGGIVDGSAVAVNGEVIRRPGGIVKGETTSVAGWHQLNKIPWHFGNWHVGTFLGLGILGSVLLAALIVAIFPGKFTTVADLAIQMPAKSALYGIVGLLLSVSIAIALTITIIGIPLMVVEVLLLVMAALVAHIGIGAVIGRKLGAAFNKPGISIVMSAVLGVLVLDIVKLVPFFGPLIVFILNIIGYGAVILTGFGTSSNWYENRFQKKTPAPVIPSTDLVKPDPLGDFDDTSKI